MNDTLADPVGFWDQRHGAMDPWRAGGDRGLSPEENYEFYAFRLGRIIEMIRRHAGAERPLRILDAGCGRGHLTDGLRRCGHHVVGIDSSSNAIEWATQTYGPHFTVSGLQDYRPKQLFDVVLCVDVLFHILDDEVWRAALASFGRCASVESLLLITGVFDDARSELGNYIVHRSRAEYDEALTAHDFVRRELLPYHFGSNQNQFAAYRRAL